jgi:hypothetical protein
MDIVLCLVIRKITEILRYSCHLILLSFSIITPFEVDRSQKHRETSPIVKWYLHSRPETELVFTVTYSCHVFAMCIHFLPKAQFKNLRAVVPQAK